MRLFLTRGPRARCGELTPETQKPQVGPTSLPRADINVVDTGLAGDTQGWPF